MAAGCENGSLNGLSIPDREQVFSFKLPSSVNCCHFLSETVVSCGCDDGLLALFDVRQSAPLHLVHHSNSRILSLTHYSNSIVVGRGDGTAEVFHNSPDSLVLSQKLTGPLCDPLPCVAIFYPHIYTGCRDGVVRKYKLE